MAGLLLTLDGVLYQVRADGPAAWRLLALQGKRAGAEYRVTAGGCSCPAAQFHGWPCKHRKALGVVELLPALAEEATAQAAGS